MLQALLEGLAGLPEVTLTVMLDGRLEDRINRCRFEKRIIEEQDNCLERFQQLAETHDAVWPVAPEFDGILLSLSQTVENLGKILLASASSAVSLAGDKYRTFLHLTRHRIPSVPTQLFEACRVFPGECIVKPIDGVGCEDSYLIRKAEDFERISTHLQEAGRYIMQPHLQGDKTSLSCLFKDGQAWLLSVNLQKFRVIDNQYRLSEIWVNYHSDHARYRTLVAGIAEAMPGLWGYAGIDLIETHDQIYVLEINPRLTTSFAGLSSALGLNACALAIDLLQGDPMIRPTSNRTFAVTLDKDENE